MAILRQGGAPIFLDMTADYYAPNLDILKDAVERHRVQGVMWVHIGGLIVPDFPEVAEYCRAQGLFLIEDCAHAHGSMIGGRKAGSLADGGAFSFFPTKVMTTIEGGMITTNDRDLADLARSLRNQGKRDGDYGGLHYDPGSSLRMAEISARMGLTMLAKLDQMVDRRSRAAAIVGEMLDRAGIAYCHTDHMDRASTYKLIVKAASAAQAAAAKARLEAAGIRCGGGVYEVPCHLHPVFAGVPRSAAELVTTTTWCPRQVCPPITSSTSEDDARRIGSALVQALG
jgi:dTDP-4-amino-4,6-dideoxygalactose transaminase